MSIYNPPTKDQSIFNPSNYGGLGVGGEITTEYLNANFLAFPVAQGNITLVSTNVLGDINQTGNIYTSGDIQADDIDGDVITGNSILVGTNNLLTEITTNSGRITTAEGNITTNTTNIATNTSDIATLTSSITGFQSQIDTNATNITTNTNNIGTLQTTTATNTTDIATNTSDIATLTTQQNTNTSAIATNTSDIATNTSNIATNTSNIATNTSNIASNTSSIGTLTTQQNTNTSAIATLTTQQNTNTSAIATNTSNITTNTSAISSLTSQQSTNTSNIASLTTQQNTNTSNIATNTSDIATNSTAISGKQDTLGVSSNITTGTIGSGTITIRAGSQLTTPIVSASTSITAPTITASSNLFYGVNNVATKISGLDTRLTTAETDITALETLTASHTTSIANIAGNTANISNNASDIATLQTNLATTNSNVASNTTAIGAKQDLIGDGDLTIARTNGLQSALDGKQATIADGDLTIAKTNGLQTALDGKQATIGDGDLTISRTSGLQSALDGKQPTIADGDLTIAKTSGLQSALDGKQPTIADGDLTIAKTNGLQSALDGKQATIGDGDLTIARTNGLQSALDGKQATLTTSTNLDVANIECDQLKVYTGGSGPDQIIGSDINHQIQFRYNNTNTLSLHEYGDIKFFTGGGFSSQTEKMVIESGGNVGIGTSSPSEVLEVNGFVKAGSNNKQGNLQSSSTAFGHSSLFNSNEVALNQYSAGSTHINCGSNGVVKIRRNGTEMASFDATTIVFNQPIERKSNFAVRYFNGNMTLVGTVDYARLNATQMGSSLYFLGGSNEGIGVYNAGLYRIVASCSIEQTANTSRSVIQVRLVVNGSYSNVNGQAYCYLRQNAYGSFGSINIETALSLSANDLVKIEYRLDKDTGNSFTDNFNSQYRAVSQRMIVEYLGV